MPNHVIECEALHSHTTPCKLQLEYKITLIELLCGAFRFLRRRRQKLVKPNCYQRTAKN